jgi:hypothetical protein
MSQVVWLAAEARELTADVALDWSPRETGGPLFRWIGSGHSNPLGRPRPSISTEGLLPESGLKRPLPARTP